MHASPLLLLFIASAILNASLAIYGWRHRHLPGAIAFSLAMLLFTFLPLSQAINISSSDFTIKVIALKSRVEMAGIGATAWLVMVMQFSGYARLVNRRLLLTLSSVPLAILILNWTENPLFRSGYHLELVGASPALRWTNGPIFWVGLLYLNAVLLTPIYLLWRSYGRISPLSFRQTLALSISTILPLIINLLSQVGIAPVQGINFPFAAGPVMGLIIAWAILRYHIFDLLPIARGLLIESMNDGVLVLDTQNRIVDINPAMQELIGPVALGQNADAAFATWPDLVTRFRGATETRTEVAMEGNPPGYFDLRISSLIDRRRKLTGRLIVVRDITRHKQIENALHASENNFRRMLESAPDAMLIVDQEGKITLANVQCEKIFGYPQSELMGQSVEILLPERFRQIHKTHRADYYQDPQARPMGADTKWELLAYRKDGSIFPIEISLSPLDTETGLFTMAAIRDITERKRLETQLRLQATALEATVNAIVITDFNGVIQWVNPAFTQLTGYSFVESIGRTPQLIRSGRHNTVFYETLWNTINSGSVWEGELINRRKDGSEYFEHQTITPVRDERGGISHFISMKQDITQRKHAEQALREAELKYRTLVEQMPAVIYVYGLDEANTAAYVSPQIEALLGYPFARWEQNPSFWKKCIHPEDYDRAIAVTPNTLIQERVTEEYRMIAKDGRVIWVRDHSTLARDASGQPQFVQGFWEDITERKHAEAELQTALKRTEVLYDVVSSAISSESLSASLNEIVQKVAQGLPANRVSLITFDQSAQKIKNFVRGGVGEDQVRPSISYNELMDGLSGWVIRTGQTALSPKNKPDARESEMVQKRRAETNCGSILVTPVEYHNQILGTLTIINLPEDPDFTEEDAELLEAVASQISSIIDKITLEDDLRRQNDYLAALHQISLDLLNQRNVDDLLNAIISNATRLLDAPYADLDLIEGDVMIARAYSANQSFEEGLQTRRGEGAAASWQVYDTRQPISIDDYANWSERNPVFEHLPIRATIIVPLISGDDCLGVFSLSRSASGRPFTPDEIRLTSLFAQQAALALGNAQLYAEAQREITARKRTEETLRRQNDYLSILHEITLGLTNHHDPDVLLEAILQHAANLMNTRHALVDIVDPEKNVLIQKVAIGNYTAQLGFRTRLGEGLSGRVWATGDKLMIPDYSVWENRLPEFSWLRTVTSVPMKVQGRVIGVIGVAFDEPDRAFTPEEIDLLQRFANLASMALDNAQLISGATRQSQELSLLHKVRTVITSEIDLTHIVKRTVEAIAEIFGYTLVSLYLREGDILTLQHQVGYESVIPTIPITAGVSGRVIRTGKPIFLEDVHSDPSFLEALEGIVSEIAVPILDEGHAVGVINIESRYGIKLTEADLRLMLALSDQISIAIGRARLYDSLQRNNKRLSILHEISLDILNQRDPDDLLQSITDQIVKSNDAAVGYIALKENGELVDRAITPRDFPYQMTRTTSKNDISPAGQVFESHEPFITDDFSALSNIRPETAALGLKAAIFLPILYGETCLGVIGAGRTRPNYPFDQDDINFGGLFAKLAAVALDNAKMHHTLREESIRDPLTGLFNRRFMQEALAQEVMKAKRTSHPLAVVMFDLDYFKRLNDTFGHDAGDEALRRLGHLLKTTIRGSDIACRYGGEEFTLILPEASLTDAAQRIEQLRRDIKALVIRHQAKSIDHLSGSFGIAVYPEHGTTGEALLKSADEALYQAKQAGRDRVIVAST